MLEILQFVFSGFWTFVGCAMLFGTAVKGVVGLANAIRGTPITNITNNHAESKT